MAKAKNPESAAAEKPAAKKAAAPKKAAGAAASSQAAPKKPAAGKKSGKADKAAPAAAAPQAPLIDTGLAAQAAAAMVANRFAAGLGAAQQPGDAPADPQQQPAAAARPESSTFKNLKDSLNKPAGGGTLGGILGTGGGQRKFNQGFGGPKQSGPGGGRNQTFGADVNRTGVPRRTGG